MADKLSMVRILGSSRHSKEDREKNDFYATDPHTVVLLLDKLHNDGVTIDHNIWECACGDGAISEILKQNGYDVYSTDICDRKGYRDEHIDFLLKFFNLHWKGDILTNPPFKHAEQFVRLAMERINDGNKIVFLLRLQFLEGVARRKLFDEYPPKYVYVHSKRQNTYKGNCPKLKQQKLGAVCYAWYIWEKGFSGNPQIRWI